MKIKKVKRTTKKVRARTIQKAKGKGPNININIDQSRRGEKGGLQRAPPSIISTSTPQFIPQYMPMFNQPPPAPYAFQSAIQNTQARVNEPINNELEKPKKVERSEAGIQTDDLAEAFTYPIAQAQPVQFVESFPADEEKPQINKFKILPHTPKPVTISTQTDLLPDAQLIPMRRRRSSDTQTDAMITNVFGTQTENPITASLGTNTETRDTTPLEQQAKEEVPSILTVYNKPKERAGGSNIMTFQELNEPETNRRIREELNRGQEFRAFLSSGQRLGGDDVIGRLSREELRKKREEALNKDKPKPVINPPEEKPTIETLDMGLSPEEIEEIKQRTTKYRQAEEKPDEVPVELVEPVEQKNKYDLYLEEVDGLNFKGLKARATQMGIPLTNRNKGAKNAQTLREEIIQKYNSSN